MSKPVVMVVDGVPMVSLRAYQIVCSQRDALITERDTLLATKAAPARRLGRTLGREPLPAFVIDPVRARSRGRCVACGKPGRDPHHILPQQKWPEHRLEPDLIVLVCRGCHDDHERASHRIPFEALPDCALEQATRLADPRILAYIHQTYPRAVAA